VIGRPKSATFRTADVVGIDTLVKVAKGVADNCPDDEAKKMFAIPSWLDKMVANNWLGDKTKQGFYKKTTSENGTEILTLNLANLEYQPKLKKLFPTLQAIKNIDSLTERLKKIHLLEDNAGMFYKKMNATIFSYISFRIPEITNHIFNIDNAIKAGFGWEIGAFELWDLLGVGEMCTWMGVNKINYAHWIDTMLLKGFTQFYLIKDNKKYYYDIETETYQLIPNQQQCIIYEQYKNNIVWQNDSCKLIDIGDEVLGLKWNTKMNTIGGDVIAGINQSIQIAEKDFKGIVIANDGPNFSVGANIALILMMAVEQDYDELDLAIATFQNTMMRIKYSSIPIAVAPHGLCFGGGCELSLHADILRFVPETYIGLVEVGIGLIPAGGGTKEFTIRASDEVHVDEPDTIPLKNWFLKIATGQVSTSAFDAQKLGILRKGIDKVVMNPAYRIFEAKQSILQIQNTGYLKPIPRKDIRVLGRTGLGLLEIGANAMLQSGYATKHEIKVANKLANVMCGGDLSETTVVSEQYLLNLEREAFLSLCGEKKTLERIESMLKTGKTIRN
ncbi:MAG: 3-hydroxyacyl-CoA dehydrogenase family protein, partial [Sediminibacterium sp.]|nr:3-hydroxyacyl-CoA dehydrogenase family protein [Sediminibacterium sp.]